MKAAAAKASGDIAAMHTSTETTTPLDPGSVPVVASVAAAASVLAFSAVEGAAPLSPLVVALLKIDTT
jgi:hypothetical protein